MFDTLQPILQDSLITIVTGVLIVLSSFIIALTSKGIKWISKKTQTIQNDNTRKDIEEALSKLESIVTITVASLQQTLGDDIKNSIANADGVYTKDDLYALKDLALITVKRYLTSGTTELLESVYDNLDDLVGDMIEVAVRDLKYQSNSTTVDGTMNTKFTTLLE